MTENGMGFGISSDLKANNKIPFKGGIQKGYLTSVKSYEKTSKKGEVYDVLEFSYTDLNNEATHETVEFAIKPDDAKFGDKMLALNKRIKHIYEAFKPMPDGLGNGAKSFSEFFGLVAKAFNENGKDGSPIFKMEDKFIPVFIKFTYYNNNLGTPYAPNFIEVIKQGKETTLVIDKRYDSIEQIAKTGGLPGLGATLPNASADMSDWLD